MSDSFEQLVQRVPITKRCQQSSSGNWDLPLGECLFGVPSDEWFGWTALHSVPEHADRFSFLLGSEALPLLTAFAGSPWARIVTSLVVGESSFGLGQGRDYRAIVKVQRVS